VPIRELLLPRTSDAMTEAVVSRWLVADESDVTAGTVVAEVETDKALVEVVAENDGLLVAAASEGANVPVGAVIAYVLDGPDVQDYRDGRVALATPLIAQATVSTPEPDRTSKQAEPHPAALASGPSPMTPSTRSFASPLARRLARESGLSLDDLFPGSGPNGRVVRADVLSRVKSGGAQGGPEMSSRQRSMVAAMVGSKSEVPHFYLFRDVDLGAVGDYRRALAAAELPVPSITTMLVKALGVVLASHEFARRRWVDGRVQPSNEAHVGVAVADGLDDIVVTVVRDPGRLSLAEVAGEITRLSESVRSRTLRLGDAVGATATISNLGMHGIDALLPIIPPGQSFILGIGRERSQLALGASGQVESRSVVTFGFAGDHRVLTGLGGARILAELDQVLQHPLRLAQT
jgi:pyruvate dehydrogenase E2 component (dihydrolipoamide acetyltransferase)